MFITSVRKVLNIAYSMKISVVLNFCIRITVNAMRLDTESNLEIPTVTCMKGIY